MDDLSLEAGAQNWGARYLPYAYLLVLTLSLSGNVYLGRQAVILNHLKTASSSSAEGKTGEHLDSLTVQTIAGTPSSIQFSNQQDTVVYIFSPACHWCALNLSNIRSLVRQRNGTLNFIGISITSDGVREYVDRNHLSFPIYIDKSARDFSSPDFSGTPQTLLIRRDGTVEHNWIGAYVGDTQTDIERALSVHLPGLSAVSR